jgi:hypothetical protein
MDLGVVLLVSVAVVVVYGLWWLFKTPKMLPLRKLPSDYVSEADVKWRDLLGPPTGKRYLIVG